MHRGPHPERKLVSENYMGAAIIRQLSDYGWVQIDKTHWHHIPSDTELIVEGMYVRLYPDPSRAMQIERMVESERKQDRYSVCRWWHKVYRHPQIWAGLMCPCPYYHMKGCD